MVFFIIVNNFYAILPLIMFSPGIIKNIVVKILIVFKYQLKINWINVITQVYVPKINSV